MNKHLKLSITIALVALALSLLFSSRSDNKRAETSSPSSVERVSPGAGVRVPLR